MALRIYPSKNEPTINLSYQSYGDDVITTEGGDAKTFTESETKKFPEFWKNHADFKIVNNSTYKMKVTLYRDSTQWDIYTIESNSSQKINMSQSAYINYEISAYGGGNQFQAFTHKFNEGGCVNVSKVMRKLRQSISSRKERYTENHSDTCRTAYSDMWSCRGISGFTTLERRVFHQWKYESYIRTNKDKYVTTLNYNPSSKGRRIA